MDNVQKEMLFQSGQTSTRRPVRWRRKGRSSSPAPNSKAKTDEGTEIAQKHQETERKALQTRGAKFRAFTNIVKTRHVISASSRVSNYKLMKESAQLGCVSQDSFPRKCSLREKGKLGSKHTVKFSKGTWHQIKIRERKGPSRGTITKCEPL